MTDQERRFWSKVRKGSKYSCWEWTGAKSNRGYHERRGTIPYGHMQWDGKTRKAHIISFLLSGGTMDPNLVIHHKCNNALCVNPEHLEQCTPEENQQAVVTAGHHRGYFVRLTKDQVRKIKRNKTWSHSRLAEHYGTSKQNIEHIKAGRTWRHVK